MKKKEKKKKKDKYVDSTVKYCPCRHIQRIAYDDKCDGHLQGWRRWLPYVRVNRPAGFNDILLPFHLPTHLLSYAHFHLLFPECQQVPHPINAAHGERNAFVLLRGTKTVGQCVGSARQNLNRNSQARCNTHPTLFFTCTPLPVPAFRCES